MRAGEQNAWLTYHLQSEQLASLAQQDAKECRSDSATEYYRNAAEQEQLAFDCLNENKARTSAKFTVRLCPP